MTTIKDIGNMVDELIDIVRGHAVEEGVHKRAKLLLSQDATTHNIEETKKFLDEYWRNR